MQRLLRLLLILAALAAGHAARATPIGFDDWPMVLHFALPCDPSAPGSPRVRATSHLNAVLDTATLPDSDRANWSAGTFQVLDITPE